MAQGYLARRKFAVVVTVLTMILATVVAWGIQEYRNGGSFRELSFQWFVLIVVLAFMIPFLVRLRRDIQSGLPVEDERSKRIKSLAGYYSFLISIYLWLVIMFFEEYFTVSSAAGAAILGSAITFGLAYVILSRRPKLD